ncbi:MAG: VWA domain-containing protein [Bacteroidetes bacterium]|nr:MAG: VWA domain-containing protein [Bacteroidota bacterium]
MNLLFKPAIAFFSSYLILGFSSPVIHKVETQSPKKMKSSPKIQAAILLDVSNSMDGLIEQAKAQLWTMVNVMGKAKCNGETPKIEIALYEYGRDNNDLQKGYVKQITPFTSDLDNLSQKLFQLTTNGGQEYCGYVIHTSLNELNWDSTSSNYKVIFISGNEDFLQGNISYTMACSEAKNKGVIVNTIYCGDRLQGIKEHWNLLGECGNGSFTNINSDAKPEDIPTPYDSTLITLNNKLNGTYIYYGAAGRGKKELQGSMDEANLSVNKYAGVNRAVSKASPQTYNNSSWDLIDAKEEDKNILDKIDLKTLPDSLKTKNKQQLEMIVNQKSTERSGIQKEIQDISKKREAFINAEKIKKTKAGNNSQTLESEVEKIIREQATRFNMKIE